MIEKLQHILSENQRYYVLGISILADARSYQLIELSYKNKELQIENRYSSNSFNDIVDAYFKNKYPVILHFEGDNIINKTVEQKTGYRKNLIFNADSDDFYFYEYHQGSLVFLSIVRKSFVDDFIQKFMTLDFFVVHVSFGPFVMMNLIPFIKSYNSISSTLNTLKFTDNELQSFDNEGSEKDHYNINDETFSSSDIPLVSTFFDYQFPNPSITFEREFLNKNKSEYKYSKWFKKLGIFTLVFVLASLFMGHNLLNYYLETLTEKQLQRHISQQAISDIENLKNEVSLKEKILITSGLNNTKFLTNYISDIGNSVLDDITINSININPTFKKIKSGEKIDFNLNEINILGESSNYKTFNDWVNKMKRFDWIKKIDIIEYSKETKDIDVFKITIRV